MTTRRLCVLFASVVAALALLITPASAVGDPEVHHSGTFWAWDAPASFVGSESANGITITGPSGAVVDTGFSSTICAPGANYDASVVNFFAGKRQGLRQQGFALSNVSNIVHPTGTPGTYRRQKMNFTITVSGVAKRGKFTFDYDFNEFVNPINYCYSRNLGIYSNAAQFAALRTTLNNINNSLVYFGPGACDPAFPPLLNLSLARPATNNQPGEGPLLAAHQLDRG